MILHVAIAVSGDDNRMQQHRDYSEYETAIVREAVASFYQHARMIDGQYQLADIERARLRVPPRLHPLFRAELDLQDPSRKSTDELRQGLRNGWTR